MILAAGLLVLLAVGLFVGGLATGTSGLYWSCVAVSIVAAILVAVAALRHLSASTGPRSTRGTTTGPPSRAPAYDAPVRDAPVGDARVRDAPVRDAPVRDAPLRDDAEPPHADTANTPAADAGPAAEPAVPPADRPRPGPGNGREPPAEDVEFADLLLVMDLRDPVHVVGGRPHYHLAECRHLGDGGVPVPLHDARADGFTPCGSCAPDRHLAGVELARRGGRSR